MGRLATIAEEHYRKFLPKTYEGLTDPAAFFRNLETEAEQQIEALTDRLEGADLPGEDLMAKAGRLRQARLSAEEIVMRETVLIDPATVELEREPQETDYPSTGDPLVPPQPETPEDRQLALAMTDWQDAVAELAETRPSSRPEPTTPDSPPKE